MGIKELKENRDKIYALASKYGANHIRIFGSVVTGKNHPNSDIDFLVDLSPGRSIFDLGGLLMDLHNLLGCEVDVVTENGLRPRIRNHILNEAIPL
jgi:predicted nucleotidyltransferase